MELLLKGSRQHRSLEGFRGQSKDDGYWGRKFEKSNANVHTSRVLGPRGSRKNPDFLWKKSL